MAKLTTDILWLAPIRNSQSHARKARHTISACKCETRQAIPACKVQKAIPACIAKDTVYKGLLEAKTVDKQWTSGMALGVRRAEL